MKKPQLTFEELEALLTYARVEGKKWRSSLYHSWLTGLYGTAHQEYAGILRGLRRRLGPARLYNLKLPLK
jgi:hypothetical protein